MKIEAPFFVPIITEDCPFFNEIKEELVAIIIDIHKKGPYKIQGNFPKGEHIKGNITESDEIDLVAIWNTLIQRKWFIFKVTGLFTTIGIIYSVLATPYYKSTISLYPAGEITESSSIFG